MDREEMRGAWVRSGRRPHHLESGDGGSLTRPSARPPAIPFIAAGGAGLALWGALSDALQLGTSVQDALGLFSQWLLINSTALSLVLLTLWVIKNITGEHTYRSIPAPRAYFLSYGSYALAGLMAGLARYGLSLLMHAAYVEASLSDRVAAVLMVLIPTMGIGLIANVYHTFTERLRSQQAMLQEQVEELEKSRQLITTAEENLRREIAELLHGRVQSRLVVAWHRLGQCEQLITDKPAEAKALLRQVRGEIDDIREHEVRQASHLLHPSIIQVGLVPAVRSVVHQYVSDFRVALHIDPKLIELDNPANNRIPESIRLVGYRVIEEALSNIGRHAHAAQVDISLAAGADQRLGIVILDDGQGFDTTRFQRGLGLNAIATRVEQSGGAWFISSAPGRGTRLSAFLPFPSAEDEYAPGNPSRDTKRSTTAAHLDHPAGPARWPHVDKPAVAVPVSGAYQTRAD